MIYIAPSILKKLVYQYTWKDKVHVVLEPRGYYVKFPRGKNGKSHPFYLSESGRWRVWPTFFSTPDDIGIAMGKANFPPYDDDYPEKNYV